MNENPFKPLTIGTLRLKNNLIAAPLAGISSLPFRLLAMEQGCSLCISEMIASEGSIKAPDRIERFFKNDPRVRPFGVQVWGAKPEYIFKSVERLSNEPIDLIDINMGCPAKKICKKGAGSALLKTPELAAKIIKAAREATCLPLTVKMRSGWNDDINCIEIAKLAEDCGADAITIHPRTKKQGFTGKADWKLIAGVKEAVSIPVIGNGDVKCRADAIRMLDETGCDGVMIGRAAVGNPWIFKEILDENFARPSMDELCETALRHLDMMRDLVDERYAVLNMRTIIRWYGKGIPNIKSLMKKIYRINNFDKLKDTILEFFTSLRRSSISIPPTPLGHKGG